MFLTFFYVLHLLERDRVLEAADVPYAEVEASHHVLS
jgi:hypothetical protein